jgi:tetratricopeptide (TPR) repeat protein
MSDDNDVDEHEIEGELAEEAAAQEAASMNAAASEDYYDKSLRFEDVSLSASAQLAADATMWAGMEVFFDNNIRESSLRFATHSRTNPLYLLGVAAIESLAAVLSLERAQIDKATRVLSATEQFAAGVLPRDFGGLLSLGKWMMGKTQRMSNAELRARVIRAESSLVLGFLQIFQESVISYVRAGINLRAAWKGYAYCYAQIAALSEHDRRQLYDFHTIGGIQFGMGAINLAISSLPTKVVRLVSIFGLPHDRPAGFALLRDAIRGYTPSDSPDDAAAALGADSYQRDDAGNLRGVRSPLAALVLCGYYLLIPQFAPVLTDEYVPQGLALLEKELKLHPKSATHWWLYGRAHRSQRRLRRSGEAFATAARGGVDFVQIVHVNYYELGFNCLFGQRWADARCFFEILLRDNTWSRALYAYVLAVCEAMCGNQTKADEYYAAAPSYIDRTYGGRVLSVEQFVQRRSAAHKSRTTGSARLDAIELCYLWNGFPQTPFKVLAKFLSMVEDSEDALLNDLEGPKFHGKSDDNNDDEDGSASTSSSAASSSAGSSSSSSSVSAEALAMLSLYKKLPRGERKFDFDSVRARAVKANNGADLSDAATLKQLAQSGKIEDLAIHWLVRACLLKELNCHDAAEALYERMGVLEKLSLVKSETWVFPWTLFDYASLKYAQNDLDAAKALLDRVQKFSDFSFEYRLYLRAHLLTKAVEEKQEKQEK